MTLKKGNEYWWANASFLLCDCIVPKHGLNKRSLGHVIWWSSVQISRAAGVETYSRAGLKPSGTEQHSAWKSVGKTGKTLLTSYKYNIWVLRKYHSMKTPFLYWAWAWAPQMERFSIVKKRGEGPINSMKPRIRKCRLGHVSQRKPGIFYIFHSNSKQRSLMLIFLQINPVNFLRFKAFHHPKISQTVLW